MKNIQYLELTKNGPIPLLKSMAYIYSIPQPFKGLNRKKKYLNANRQTLLPEKYHRF